MSSYRAPSRRLSRTTVTRECAEKIIRLAFDGRSRMPAHEFAAWCAEAILSQQRAAIMRDEYQRQVEARP